MIFRLTIFVLPAQEYDIIIYKAFKFLCSAADIPCITISTTNRTWDLIYVDGQWFHVDVAYNDYNNTDSMLLTESYPNHPDQAPEATEFLKELLVPDSTK